ncbi:hypothetical protein HKX48_007343 [Thoreauomyces humboldtii]|nr:hypothetical protein HKX48_007343 [Thoreauomyces humboldtii]
MQPNTLFGNGTTGLLKQALNDVSVPSSSPSEALVGGGMLASKENDLGMPWDPDSFSSASASYEHYGNSFQVGSYPETTTTEAIWGVKQQKSSPYFQEPSSLPTNYARAHDRSVSYSGSFPDRGHQTPPRLVAPATAGQFQPPTPAHSPYGEPTGYDGIDVDRGTASSLQHSPDRNFLGLSNRSKLEFGDTFDGPLGLESTSLGGFSGGDSYLPLSGSLPMSLPYEDYPTLEHGRINHTRNIALDNLPVHISLAELKSLLQSFGDIRYMFRPKQGLYSGVVVMFYDLNHSMNAFRALCSMHLGTRRNVTYFVDSEQLVTLFGDDSASLDPFMTELLDNQGEILLSGLAHRDDGAVLRILETYGKVHFLRSFAYGSNISYAAEFLDTRAAREAFDGLHGLVIQDYPIHVAFPRSLSGGFGAALPVSQLPVHYNRTDADLEAALQAKVRQMNSQVSENHSGARSWQYGKHKGLKIDTSSPAVPPSPLRRAASANCVTASLARELETSMLMSANHGGSRTALPLGRSNSTRVPGPQSRVLPPASPARFRKGSQIQESGSPMPVPPPNEHSIPVANELNLYNIAMGYDTRTTFMIRNIPNKYTQQMLIAFLNRTHKGEFDFLYLRMDFKNRCNVGYAFINFTGSAAILSFAERVVGKKWSKFNSDKVCTLSYANIQGQGALIQKFRNSSVMLEAQDWRPKIFYTEGPTAGEEEPFPFPTMAIRPRSDVLFSRDNAGQPHKVAGPESPIPIQNGRDTPRRRNTRDTASPSVSDRTQSSSATVTGGGSLDELDFSKLSLDDRPIERTALLPVKSGVISTSTQFPTWTDNSSSGGAQQDVSNRFTEEQTNAAVTAAVAIAAADQQQQHYASWTMP